MPNEISPASKQSALVHVPLFQSLAPSQLEALSRHAQEMRLEKAAFLFHKGENPRGFYIVICGQIKLILMSAGGDEKIIDLFGPQQSFGEAAMFIQRPYPVSAVALSDSLLIHISQESVDHLIEQDPSFAKRMLAGLSFRLRSLVHDVETYSIRSSCQRVIGYLLQHCPEAQQGAHQVELATSKLVVASRLNLTPETLSRVFADLSQQGLLDVRKRVIHIPDLEKLRRFMG